MRDGPERITKPFLDVLEAFLDVGGAELHGWALIDKTKRSGPTIYKILERMSEMGWITARWEEVTEDTGRPRRRYYRFTGDGAAKARVLVQTHRPSPVSKQTQPHGAQRRPGCRSRNS